VCVSDAARKMAVNLYSKQMGDTHPNIRFINVEYPFRFQNAVIWPEISEGYVQAEDLAHTFPQFLHFPPRSSFTVKMGIRDLSEDELSRKKPRNVA
jgi:hypothetical protein